VLESVFTACKKTKSVFADRDNPVSYRKKMALNYAALGFNEEQNIMLQDGSKAISRAELWEWFKNIQEPAEGYSKMMCREINIIGHFMAFRHHGETFNETMRTLHLEAQLGIDEFCAMHSGNMVIDAPSAPKKVVPPRSPEMDAKVIDEYRNRPPFKSTPKWSKEYITAYPAVLGLLEQ